ncbi:MAG: hypothetical protein AAFV72_19235 [Cyanobacteria bacterium J06635_1]
MIVASIEAQCRQTPEWQQQCQSFEQAQSFPALVCAALQLGLVFARMVLETELGQRAQAPQRWPMCECCESRYRSKGFRPRQMMTLVGVVK